MDPKILICLFSSSLQTDNMLRPTIATMENCKPRRRSLFVLAKKRKTCITYPKCELWTPPHRLSQLPGILVHISFTNHSSSFTSGRYPMNKPTAQLITIVPRYNTANNKDAVYAEKPHNISSFAAAKVFVFTNPTP